MAPQYVKPYVKRQKNDRADAEAICEAVARPSMRFVAVKSEEQQSTLAIHRVRETLVAQKLINALRAHLAEFGIVAPQGAGKVSQLSAVVADLEDTRVPALARSALQGLVDQLRDTDRRVEELDARLAKQAREDKVCQRLTTIPGIGPITATALTATIGDATVFASGRHLAAWLVPRQHSSGGRERLLQGGRRLPSPAAGAWGAGGDALAGQDLALAVLKRRPVNVAVVALANKLARIAVMTREEDYRKPDAVTEPARG